MGLVVFEVAFEDLDSVRYEGLWKVEGLSALIRANRLKTAERRVEDLEDDVFFEHEVAGLQRAGHEKAGNCPHGSAPQYKSFIGKILILEFLNDCPWI
jgi:hypothetical protein